MGLAQLSAITQLQWDHAPAGFVAAVYSAVAQWVGLKSLALRNCLLDNASCCDLAGALDNSSSLTQLLLSENRVGDVGAAALAKVLRKQLGLCHLDLRQNPLRSQDAGARCLKGALARLPVASNWQDVFDD